MATHLDHDIVIVGAGVCGIYLLHRMRELGFNVTVIETGKEPGGTWYWNRYPGARFDSESYTYGYSFSKELLDEWEWSEHFSGQPETLRYLNHVIDRFGLRDGFQCGLTVESAQFDPDDNTWSVDLSDGRTLQCRFLMTAVGLLSAHTLPKIPGMENFKGQSFHTYHWPKKPVEMRGQRVGIIGTGATGVQVIAEIADKVGELTVFQRRPNWCAPLNNGPIDPKEQADIKSRYDEIFAVCKTTPGGFLHGPDRRRFDEVTDAERQALWEDLYAGRGFGIWLGNFRDVLMDPDANKAFSDFIANKIRERVKDPATAEKLIPKDHGFGTRRVPLETRYYEAYNRDNVHLVDINETPIEAITETGLRTSETSFEFDVIIYATGFDAITGAFDRMEIKGEGGQRLEDKWRDGPETYLGLQTAGFPNLLMLAGPQSASVSTNFPRGIEETVDWVSELMRRMQDNGHLRIEADAEAEREWCEHVGGFYEGSLISTTKSWFTGYNSNVEGHDTLRHLVYFGGAPKFREIVTDVAKNDYRGFVFR
ncbi:MAG: NAD(P)/FAD-dependent oxidoreductase [Pseudomonadota bacterium]